MQTPFPARMPIEKPTDRELSTSMERASFARKHKEENSL